MAITFSGRQVTRLETTRKNSKEGAIKIFTVLSYSSFLDGDDQ